MTNIMKLPEATTGLWMGNLFGILFLLLAVAYQLGGAIFASGAHMPEINPLSVQPVPQPETRTDIGSRNPFDPSAARWKASGGNNPAITGELRGVILLPGVQTVVTSNGTVRVGETLPEGRVVRILDDKIVVEQGGGNKELELPSARRPTLKSINKADHGPNTTKGSK
jgi:hypothetical protein